MKLNIRQHFEKLKDLHLLISETCWQWTGVPTVPPMVSQRLDFYVKQIEALLEAAPEHDDEIPNTNLIQSYMHCGHCLSQIPAGVSPKEWGQLEAGWTELGFQIVCKRCGRNVCHIDFENAVHPANLTTPAQEGRLPS